MTIQSLYNLHILTIPKGIIPVARVNHLFTIPLILPLTNVNYFETIQSITLYMLAIWWPFNCYTKDLPFVDNSKFNCDVITRFNSLRNTIFLVSKGSERQLLPHLPAMLCSQLSPDNSTIAENLHLPTTRWIDCSAEEEKTIGLGKDQCLKLHFNTDHHIC